MTIEFRSVKIPCTCKHPLHFIELTDYNDGEYGLQVVVDTAPLWTRIKNAFNHVFNQSNIFVGDMIFNENNLKKMKNFLDNDENSV